MANGGLLQLVARGAESIALTYDPNITFFKSVYKRHGNFSVEPIPQKFNVKPNFGERVTCTLSKQGDLLSNVYLVVELPAFSLDDPRLQVRWVDYVGLALIKTIELEIGGTIVDRQCGDVMNVLRLLRQETNHSAGLEKMLGHVPELIDFSRSKKTYRLYVPLTFWFCRYRAMALPLVALQNSDVKINVEFAALGDLVIYSPTHYVTTYERTTSAPNGTVLTQGGSGAQVSFDSLDVATRRMFYRALPGPAVTAGGGILAGSGYELAPTSEPVAYRNKNYVFDNLVTLTLSNAFLLVDYVYVDNEERSRFYYNSHTYLIECVQWDNDKILTNAVNKIKVGYNMPVKEMYVRVQVDGVALGYNKDPFNYFADMRRTRPAIVSMRVLLNGVPREGVEDATLYGLIQQYQAHVTAGADGVFLYSWALAPMEHQPSGFCNFTKIDDVVVELQLDQGINYQNVARARIYCLTYNLLRIESGVARLGFD